MVELMIIKDFVNSINKSKDYGYSQIQITPKRLKSRFVITNNYVFDFNKAVEMEKGDRIYCRALQCVRAF
jgi:hypothetical protein